MVVIPGLERELCQTDVKLGVVFVGHFHFRSIITEQIKSEIPLEIEKVKSVVQIGFFGLLLFLDT